MAGWAGFVVAERYSMIFRISSRSAGLAALMTMMPNSSSAVTVALERGPRMSPA